ncbi:MAG TPA: hypothetical protein DCR46_03915, partial [Cytophagales bacterium]|nr:hypothetical protein [Cytophagales bacterium]
STWCDSPTDNFYSNVPGDNFFYSDAHSPGSASGTATANTVQYALDNFAWQQANKPVIPNVNYKFKMKLANWSGGAPPVFKLLINGEELDIYQVGNSATKTKTFTATDKCIWYNVEAIWNSGSSTSATLTVAEVGRTDMGHEFAMDDISFGTDGIQTDTITVKVTNCNTVTATATPNTVCTGGTVNLSATANRGGYIIKWTPATDLTNANTATPTAKPMTPGAVTYSAEARFPKTKLFANSNFELGNTDVTSTLTFNSSPGSIMNGQYSITNGETKVYHPARNTGVTDHTSNTSTGNYMIAIVDVGAERTLLSKTISVVKDSSYSVSLWALSLNLSKNDQWSFAPVNVQIKVGGTVVKSVSDIPFNSNTWVNLDYAWTATATGSVTVAIVSPAATGGQSGASVIGLDDVNIYQLGFSKTSSVTVNVTSCCNKPASVNITNSTQPIDLCQGGNTTLTGNYVDGGKTIANGGMFYVWYKQGSAPSSTASYTAISGTGTV